MLRTPRSLLHPLARLPRLLYLAVYLLCVLTPASEVEGARHGIIHVETQGTSKHHLHDEATCAAQIVLSFIGAGAPVQTPVLDAPVRLIVLSIDAPRTLTSIAAPRTYSTRAPPIVA